MSKYRDNEFQNRNYLESNKRSLVGFRVELRDCDLDHEDEIVAVGIIKGYSIRSGVMIIDCDDIMKSLEVDLPAVKTNRDLDTEEDMSFVMNLMLEQAFTYEYTKPTSGTEADIDYFYETLPEIAPYIYQEEFHNFVSSMGMSLTLSNRGIKLNELLFLAEILQMRFLLFIPNSQPQYCIRPIYFFKSFSSFDDIGIEPLTLSDEHNRPDYISDPAQTPAFFTFEFTNGKYRYNMLNKVGLVGEGEITMKFSCDSTPELVKQITDVALGYSKIVDHAVAIIKTEAPELLVREKFQVGNFYEFVDISDFETFQTKGKEVYKNLLCIKTDDSAVEFMVTGYNIYNPIAPMLTIARSVQSTPTITTLVFSKQHIKNEGAYDMSSPAIDSTSPFASRAYFAVGDYVYIYGVDYVYLGKVLITELFESGNEEFMRFDYNSAINVRYVGFPDYEDVDANDFQKKFMFVGRGVWH